MPRILIKKKPFNKSCRFHALLSLTVLNILLCQAI